ncbi:MAG: hypothetical protein ACYDD2_03075 [Candidatus Acidiferrales bacterium]
MGTELLKAYSIKPRDSESRQQKPAPQAAASAALLFLGGILKGFFDEAIGREMMESREVLIANDMRSPAELSAANTITSIFLTGLYT